jgi:hypothetical protein
MFQEEFCLLSGARVTKLIRKVLTKKHKEPIARFICHITFEFLFLVNKASKFLFKHSWEPNTLIISNFHEIWLLFFKSQVYKGQKPVLNIKADKCVMQFS